jgi:hypothetical protein
MGKSGLMLEMGVRARKETSLRNSVKEEVE